MPNSVANYRSRNQWAMNLAKIKYIGVILMMPVIATAVELRVIVPAIPAPLPGGAIVERSVQSYSQQEFFAVRKSIAVNTVRVDHPHPSNGINTHSQGLVILPGKVKLKPGPEQVVVLGFNTDEELVFQDYIPDPWLIRGEFLESPAQAVSGSPSRFTHFNHSSALRLSLPAFHAIATVDILRPASREFTQVFTPIIRISIK